MLLSTAYFINKIHAHTFKFLPLVKSANLFFRLEHKANVVIHDDLQSQHPEK